MQIYTPLICEKCWSRQAFSNITTRKQIRYGRIEQIFSNLFIYYSKCITFELDLKKNFFVNEQRNLPAIYRLIWSYAYEEGITTYVNQIWKLEQFIYGDETMSSINRREGMYVEWFRRNHIIKEILQLYVLPYIEDREKPYKLTFQLFNCTIYKEDFYYETDNHTILSHDYIDHYKWKIKQIQTQKESEFENFLNDNFETRSSGEDFNSSSDCETCVEEERSQSPSI